MNEHRYIMSFTTGGLFQRESEAFAQIFRDLGDWNAVYAKAVSDNILQSRTTSTLKRVCREVISRLRTLLSEELDFFVESSQKEQAYLLWVAVCRRFSFIADFAVEVLRERFISLKTDLTHEDFDFFFNQKAEWHPELDKMTSATRKKLRQVLFKMLREADFVGPESRINPAVFTPGLSKLIQKRSGNEVMWFPLFESELRGLAR